MYLAALLALLAPAHALTGDEIVSKMDDAMSRYGDIRIDWTVLNMLPGAAKPGQMTFTATVKGGKALTDLTSPADIKGTRVLVLARNQMYVYLPQYGKVRRVASHTTNQGFMGTTFSFDDMNAGRFGDVYDAELLSEGEVHRVQLTAKPDSSAPYARIELTVDGTLFVPLEMKYFNEKGLHTKTETRSGYECREDVCLGGSHKMVDHTRPGAWTELVRGEWALNTGLSDDLFTTRNLARGD